MQAIQDIVNNKVQSLIDENTIQEAIESSVEKAINSAIENQFQSYGNITKQISKALDEGLRINTKELPFESYNEQMLVAVKQKIGTLFQDQASDKFMLEMDRLLEPAPAEISAKTFVETIASMWKTDEPWEADDLDDCATAELRDKEYRGMSLKMWKQKESISSYSSRSNSADLHIYIIDGEIRINHEHNYNPTCFSEDEAFIFKLYAAGTVITGLDDFDPEECDLTLKECEY